MKRAVWINGWGMGIGYVGQLARALYPEVEHKIILPRTGWESRLKQESRAASVIAYSLGAFLLLGRPDLRKRFARVVLMAPFEDFKKESDRGGRISLTQLRYLRRWLENDKDAAILDFMDRAGLKGEASDQGELPKDDCIWGIDRLINDAVNPGSLEECEVFMGEEDRLLDASHLKNAYPNIRVLKGVGHDLGELLKEGGLKL